MKNICIICNDKLTYRREFCKTCYSRGMKNGSILRIVKPELPIHLTEIQEDMLIGLLLGDGCLFKYKPNQNPILAITRAKKDIEYLLEQFLCFKDFCLSPPTSKDLFDKRTNKTYYQCKMVTRRAVAFNSLYNEWYPNGKKVLPKNIKITPLSMLGWFCDDGNISITKHNRCHIKLSTNGFAIDDVNLLAENLSLFFNEKFRVNLSDGKPIIGSADNGARAFLKYIDNIFPESMLRKATWREEKVKFYENISRTKTYSIINGKYIYD